MNTGPIPFIHFIEFIDAADSHICQDQRPAFQTKFVRDGVPHDSRGESDARGTLARCVDPARGDGGDVF